MLFLDFMYLYILSHPEGFHCICANFSFLIFSSALVPLYLRPIKRQKIIDQIIIVINIGLK